MDAAPFNDGVCAGQRQLAEEEEELARSLWRRADAVCFDVDSTVIREEGLDGLAEFLDKGERIRTITLQAMGGGMSFHDALSARLGIVKPTEAQVAEYRQKHPFSLTPGVSDLVSKLRCRGVSLYLVSGGFQRLVLPVGESLGIGRDCCFCNELLFDENGQYSGFNTSRLTSDSGGKGRVIQKLIDDFAHKRIVMVGDGATDAEACPPAHLFIGFGGNVLRPGVQEKSKWYVTDFCTLSDALD